MAGGSLLLIPMACSLFGISNDIAMQMVGVGFIIGVVQDSVAVSYTHLDVYKRQRRYSSTDRVAPLEV